MPAASSSESTSGNITFGDSSSMTPWLIGLGIVTLAFVVWLIHRK